jgi:hypothetical protein
MRHLRRGDLRSASGLRTSCFSHKVKITKKVVSRSSLKTKLSLSLLLEVFQIRTVSYISLIFAYSMFFSNFACKGQKSLLGPGNKNGKMFGLKNRINVSSSAADR